MPAKTVRKPSGPNLRVYRASHDEYFVESSKSKILYKVFCHDGAFTCTCGDYTANIIKDEAYQCKHILAILNGNATDLHFHDKPRLNEKFMINIQGSEFVKYAGLLDLGHQKGIQALTVEPVQYPTKDNGFEAICKATLESPNNDIYTEYGDASPKNVNKKIVNHILRMAATRAKARCLRDYTNIGITCLEELGGDDIPDVIPPKEANEKPMGEVIPMKQKEPSAPAQEEKPAKQFPKPSEAQKRAIESLARRRGFNLDDLNDLCQKTMGVGYDYLTSADAAQFIQNLQSS